MGTKSHSRAPKAFRHRTLVAAEAVLLVGVAQQLLSQQVANAAVPNVAKILFTMIGVLGVLGGMVLLARAFAIKGVAQTHNVIKALPIPAATWLLHLAAFAGLFLLYAIVWQLPVQVPILGTVGTAPSH